MRLARNALVGLLSALVAFPALAADNMTVLDSAGATKTMRCKDVGAGTLSCTTVLLDSSFTVIDPATSGNQTTTNTKLDTLHSDISTLAGLATRYTAIVGANFTTTGTTTALSDGQLLANSATAGSVTPLDFTTACRVSGGTGMVRRARIKIPDTGFAGKSLYLKLYRDSPTVTNGDHGAWVSTESNYIGQISVTLDQHFSDPFEKGIGVPVNGSEVNYDCATTHLYGLLVANGASTTLQGSKVVTVVLETLQN